MTMRTGRALAAALGILTAGGLARAADQGVRPAAGHFPVGPAVAGCDPCRDHPPHPWVRGRIADSNEGKTLRDLCRRLRAERPPAEPCPCK